MSQQAPIAEVISLTARERVRMIYHINRFALRPDAPEDQVETARQYLHRIGRELDVVESYCVGRDIGGEFGIGAMYALKDIDAYRTYMFAPIHEQTDNAGLPIVANQVSYDITDDPDPQIGDKMAQVHRDRFAERPHLRDLIQNMNYRGPGTEDL
jgi:hypothetical protein